MKDGVALGYASSEPAYPAAGDVGMFGEGEDVDIDALHIVALEVVAPFDVERVEVAHLDDGLLGLRVGIGRLHEKIIREQWLCLADEAFEVLLVHGNVDIVIPRDETAMTDGSQKRPSVEPIRRAKLPADLVYFL